MSVFLPDKIFNNLLDIDITLLKKYDLKGLLLDIDNTLAQHNYDAPFEYVNSWINQLKSNNIKLLLVSNNNKARVSKFGKLLDIGYIYGCKKPLVKNILAGCSRLGVDKTNIAIVGDQIFTDVLGGNRAKIKTFLVIPEDFNHEKTWLFSLKRRLERHFINKYDHFKIN